MQVVQLKAEKDRMEKALRREIGKDASIAKVMDESSDWRGRAQQIHMLKERLIRLQEAQVSQNSCIKFACNELLPWNPH